MDTISVCQRLVKEAWSTSAKWKENYAEAEKLLRLDLSQSRGNVLSLTCLGAVLCDQAKHAEATEVLQEAIALGSKDRNTFFNLGVALLNTSTREAAMVEFNKARNLTADARSLEAYFDPQAH
jgi:predicted Zn-dependent protease